MGVYRLKECLAERGMTQIELARVTKIAPCNISNLARNKQHAYPKWRKKIAEALGMDESKIFGERELSEKQKKAIAQAESLVDGYVTYWQRIYYADDSDEEYIYLIPLNKNWELNIESEEAIPLSEIQFVHEIKFKGEPNDSNT